MEIDYNLAKLFKLFPRLFKKIDINDRDLFSLKIISSFILDVQRKCSEWITLAATNFGIVWAKNSQDPRDVTPLMHHLI